MTIQDEALAGLVSNAVNQDKRLAGQAIAVRVANGDVFLKGIVNTSDDRELALLVVMGVSGVRQVNIEELRTREVAE
ncbi:MAG: BON domain-containing protein [Armatimonadota bacterium]|nr:BON domain-containing protein [bacterium]